MLFSLYKAFASNVTVLYSSIFCDNVMLYSEPHIWTYNYNKSCNIKCTFVVLNTSSG